MAATCGNCGNVQNVKSGLRCALSRDLTLSARTGCAFHEDTRAMSAATVNETLSNMGASDANAFLERLGHVWARGIYDEETRKDESLQV